MIKLLTGLLLAHCLVLSGCCISSKAMRHGADVSVDNEAISFLLAVNKYEIDAAQAVMDRLQHVEVAEFAKLMIQDHEKNLMETKDVSLRKGINGLESTEVIHLKEKAQEALETLKTTEKDVEAQYIKQMVEGHREVLSKLDHFLEHVRDLDLKSHLKATREHVAHHLERAQALQK